MRPSLTGLAAALAVGAAAFAWRWLPPERLRLGGAPLLQGDSDGYEHARRVELALADGLWVPSFDGWTDAPHGAPAVWSPFFDQLVAAAAAGGSRERLERLYLWLSPALGALTAGLLAAALWPLSPAGGLAAGAAVAVLPAHRAYTVAGRFDHHGAEALALVLALFFLVRAAREGERGRSAGAAWAALGLAAAALAALWAGGLLLWAALLAGLAWEARRESGPLLALAASAAALHGYQALFGAGPPGSPPLSFAAAGGTAALLGWASLGAGLSLRLDRLAAEAGRPRLPAWLPAAAGAAAAAPGLGELAAEAASFFGVGAVREHWAYYEAAAESFPLWRDPAAALRMLGPAPLLFPFLPAALRALPAWPPLVRRQAAWLALAAVLLALAKARYMYFAALGLACLEGALFAALWAAAPGPRRAALLAAAFLALHGAQLRPAAAGLRSDRSVEAALEEGYARLAERTPAAGDPDRPSRLPSFAVLADWSLGHAIKYRARRPVLADAQGRGAAFLDRAAGVPDPAALHSLLRRRKVAFLFLTPSRQTAPGAGALSSLYWEGDAPGFRLLWQSPGLRKIGAAPPTAPVKIFAVLAEAR